MGPPSGSDLQGIGGGALPGSPVYNGLRGGGGCSTDGLVWLHLKSTSHISFGQPLNIRAADIADILQEFCQGMHVE